MAASTEICNLALSILGNTKHISNIETEHSTEARACRLFYDTTRDEVLRDFPWPFATKIVSLGLIEEDPTTEWGFSYSYPSDCLKFRRIPSGQRVDTAATRVPYKIIESDSGTVVLTDKDNAEGEYTMRMTNTARYPADFKSAFALRLASYIAPQVTAGDPFKLGDRALQRYLLQISQAQSNAASEEQGDQTPDSEFISIR